MLSSLSIRGFRGYSEASFALGRETAIIGASGSGKTHILEAVHIASGWALHYALAPRDEESSFEVRYHTDIGEKSFSLARRDGKDTYMVQGKKVSGLKYREELPFRTVFVSPFDMNLLYFAPSHRREYIDSILTRTFAQFSRVKRDYEQTMRERNALLKAIREGEAGRADLTYWDTSFAEKAHVYLLYRKKWYDFVASNMHIIIGFLGKYALRFEYTTKTPLGTADFETSILAYLWENTERDILSWHTHIWPHLDDFTFFVEISGKEAVETSLYLSRGENKLLLLALKQLEILMLRKYRDLPIVLLFDDVFAELDEIRAENMIAVFEVDQTIVSTQRALPKNEKWEHFSCINLENT